MKEQETVVTFQLESKENEGEMSLNIGVSGPKEQLKEGWMGQMLLGSPSPGLPQGGVHAVMQVLKQFKGSACNHYAHHPQGGDPIPMSDLLKHQKEAPQKALS